MCVTHKNNFHYFIPFYFQLIKDVKHHHCKHLFRSTYASENQDPDFNLLSSSQW